MKEKVENKLAEAVEAYAQAALDAEVAFISIVDNVVGASIGPCTLGVAWCKTDS